MKKRVFALLLSVTMMAGISFCVQGAAETTDVTDYSTGSPWICSNIQSNVESAGNVDLKDDFALAETSQWVKDNPIPEGKIYNEYLISFEDELNDRLDKIMKDDSNNDDHNALLVNTLYSDFTDWDARKEASTDSLKPYIDAIEEIKDYEDLAVYSTSSDYRFSEIIKINPRINPDDASRYILTVNCPALFLNGPEDYANLDNMSGYTKLTYDSGKKRVQAVLSQCGYTDSQIDEIYDGAIQFEKLFSAYCYTTSDTVLTETTKTINSQIYSADDLKDYKWFAIVEKEAENYGISNVSGLQFYNKMDYFENLDDILTDDNIDIIKDYLLAHTASGAIMLLDKDTYYKALDIYNEKMGSSGYEEEETYAIQTVSDLLGWPLSRLYCDQYVTAEDKQNISDIINDTIAAYKEILQDEDFLSDATREKAAEKLDKMRINCLYPDDWSDYDYSDLTLSDNYFDDYVAIQKYAEQRDYKDFDKNVNKNKWANTPITQNAFYSPKNNSINILPGLIGDVLYNSDMSQEEIYAMLGVVIGHEISHSFDPNGAKYDADGNYVSWWTDEDYEKFNEKTEKLVNYYNNIVVWDGLNVNGELDKTEACADMGGVAVMLHLAAKNPDFDYAKFFESYAKVWAANLTPQFIEYCVKYDKHPAHYLRTNVTVAQFDEFYETFGIKEGDGMYIAPDDRVKIW